MDHDLPPAGSGADMSEIGRGDRTGAAQLPDHSSDKLYGALISITLVLAILLVNFALQRRGAIIAAIQRPAVIRFRLGIGIAVFLFLRVAAWPFIPRTLCRDGFPSPSIGSRGACSWHGGVSSNGWAILATVLAAAAGIWAWAALVTLHQTEQARLKSENAGTRPVRDSRNPPYS